MLRNLVLAFYALLLAQAAPASAQVDMEHLLGKYATTDDGCKSDQKPEYEIRRGVLEGPNLLCILGAPKDAGEGKEAYEAKCTESGKVHLGTMTFDRSAMDKAGPMKVELPDSPDWIALYLCK